MEFTTLFEDFQNLEYENSNEVTEAGNPPLDKCEDGRLLFGREEPDFFQDYIKFANQMIYQDIPQTTLT